MTKTRRNLRRALISLGRDRLGRATGARFGRLLAFLAALLFAIIALTLHFGDHVVWFPALLQTAALTIAWLGAGPIALSAARNRGDVDRIEGVDCLAAMRGASSDALFGARALAAMTQIAFTVGWATVGLGTLTAALAGSFFLAARHLLFSLILGFFALVSGIALGGVSSACGTLGGKRGRTLFLAIVLGPWMIADFAGHPAWSIPGALAAFLSFVFRIAGGAA